MAKYQHQHLQGATSHNRGCAERTSGHQTARTMHLQGATESTTAPGNSGVFRCLSSFIFHLSSFSKEA